MTGECGDRRGSVQGAVGEKGTLLRLGVMAGAGKRGDRHEGRAPGDFTAVWNAGWVGEWARDRAGVSLLGDVAGALRKAFAGKHMEEKFFILEVIGNNLGANVSERKVRLHPDNSDRTSNGNNLSCLLSSKNYLICSPYHSRRHRCCCHPFLAGDKVEGYRTE